MLGHVWLFVTPWAVVSQASLSVTISWSLLKLMSTEPVMPSNHFIPWRSLLLLPLIYTHMPTLTLDSSPTQFSSVQSLRHIRLFATPWTAARQASLSITKFQSLLRLMSIELVMLSNHLILCCPFLLLPSIFPSFRVFSNQNSSHQVAKVLAFQLQHQSFQWTPRTDLL